MILQLFENKVLLYSLVGIFVLLFILLFIIINKSKSKNKKDEIINKEIVSEEETSSDIEKMLDKMQTDIDNQNSVNVKVFEDEQEENSIISYQELLKTSKKNDNEAQVTKKSEIINKIDDNQEINTQSYNNMDNTKKVNIEFNDDLDNTKEFRNIEFNDDLDNTKKFRNTEFISPIYGRIDNNVNYPTIPNFRHQGKELNNNEIEIIDIPKMKEQTINIEDTLDFEQLKEEIKKNDDFLKMLKDFRKNLE